MFWCFLACVIGGGGPASEGSQSQQEAQAMGRIADQAGAIANAARELESMSGPARTRVAAGGDPAEEVARMKALMGRIEEMETQLQLDIEALETRLQQSGQSTAATRE